MTDEWVRLDAPPPMPEEGEEVEIEIYAVAKRLRRTAIAQYKTGQFCIDRENLYLSPCARGGSVVAWRRKPCPTRRQRGSG